MHIFRDAFLGANVVYFKGVCVQGVPAGVPCRSAGARVWCACLVLVRVVVTLV